MLKYQLGRLMRICQFYGGDLTPFGPTSMLAAMWKASDELAGYAQQGGSSPGETV